MRHGVQVLRHHVGHACHSDVISKIETAIDDRSRINRGLLGGFMHSPLTDDAFAYLPPPPGLEHIEYLARPQSVVSMHS